MIKKLITLTAILVLSTSHSFSEETIKNSKRFDSKSFGFFLNTMTISEQSALDNELGQSVQSLGIYGQVEKNNGFLLGGGFGVLNFDDKGEFDVSVQYSGSDSYFGEEATAGGFNLYAYVGYQLRAETLVANFTTGFEVFRVERSVHNCSGCPSEDLSIDAGLYLKPRVGFKFGETWWLDVTYTFYPSGDIENSYGLALSFRR